MANLWMASEEDRKVLWEGEGWRIVDTDPTRLDIGVDTRIVGNHVGCSKTKQDHDDEYMEVSWLINDELQDGSNHQICHWCKAEVRCCVLASVRQDNCNRR